MEWSREHIAKSAFEKVVQWTELSKADGVTFTDADLGAIIKYADAYIQATATINHEEDAFVRRSYALDAGKRLHENAELAPAEVAALDPLVSTLFGWLWGA